jgi:hypothetical protein
MSIRIAADKDQPSVAIEIPLEKPLPDYDLEQIEQRCSIWWTTRAAC